jgi:cytochrome o ubiquinol oxidase subunit III
VDSSMTMERMTAPEEAVTAVDEGAGKAFLGFWIYLMTDLLMFGGLFATFAVLRTNTFGGPSERDIINLPYILAETLILLVSSSLIGLTVLAAINGQTTRVIWFLGMTFLLGATFLGMEAFDFHHSFVEGASFQRSGFLTAYYSLVGTHGLHITVGLLWMSILWVYILTQGLTEGAKRKLTLLGIFWHFLDLVWIFIFTIVYLMGVLRP